MNFRFLNIPVQIAPSFWIFCIFFTNILQGPSNEKIILGIVLILSLLVHEYGHALTAQYFGTRPIITLEAFGGNAQYDSYRITPKQSFLITLNGPLLQSVLILISYLLIKFDICTTFPKLEYFFYVTMRLNILWCLFNLIPVFPLDGGHLVRYFLERKFGTNGYRASVIIGLVSALAIMPWYYSQGYFFFGTMLLIFGLNQFSAFRKVRPLRDNYTGSDERIEIQNPGNEYASFQNLLHLKKSPSNTPTELLAKNYLQEKEDQKAYDLLLQSDHKSLKEGKCLLCKLAFERQNYSLVGKYSREAYVLDPSFETALMNSQAFANLNEPKLAGGWLETAFLCRSDREVIKDLVRQPAYDLVRDHQDFKKFVKHL